MGQGNGNRSARESAVPVFLPVMVGLLLTLSLVAPVRSADQPVRLVFIHHSCGENWLSDARGGLAKALQENKYFVSDTNYGWGPDAIGDRTDIADWPEWFAGPRSASYLDALFRESGVNAPYRRFLPDPGGENRIVMFKSCFPNSNLEGGPGDPPRRGDGLTVGNAKAIYNEIRPYFASRPDKLFVVVTAPPLQDDTHAANARAFNTWLVREWLRDYPGRNILVFDYFNVLTGKENRHTVSVGRVEYINDKGRNTLAYPTGADDDHPHPAGNRKATANFIPLLNHYYGLWAPIAPLSAPTAAKAAKPTAPAATGEPPTIRPPSTSSMPMAAAPDLIDDFEGQEPAWETFYDEAADTKIGAKPDASMAGQGKRSLLIDYDVAPGSWASCSRLSGSPQDWSGHKGIGLRIHALDAGQTVIVTCHGDRPDSLTHFEFETKTSAEAVKGWQKMDIPWKSFVQPEWEQAGGASFDPRSAMGLALMFVDQGGKRHKGRLWVDDVRFLK